MIDTATIQGNHVCKRMLQRLNIVLDDKKPYTLNLRNAVYVQRYKHKQYMTRMVDYVKLINGTPCVIAVDIDNACVYSVMTEGPKVDICFNKARGLLNWKARKQQKGELMVA